MTEIGRELRDMKSVVEAEDVNPTETVRFIIEVERQAGMPARKITVTIDGENVDFGFEHDSEG